MNNLKFAKDMRAYGCAREGPRTKLTQRKSPQGTEDTRRKQRLWFEPRTSHGPSVASQEVRTGPTAGEMGQAPSGTEKNAASVSPGPGTSF